jgi:hypothetical protein
MNIAGIWMVPQLGMSWAFRIAAGINLLVAIGALLIARHVAPAPAALANGDRGPDAPAPATATHSELVRWLVLLTFGVSGFVSFGLELSGSAC